MHQIIMKYLIEYCEIEKASQTQDIEKISLKKIEIWKIRAFRGGKLFRSVTFYLRTIWIREFVRLQAWIWKIFFVLVVHEYLFSEKISKRRKLWENAVFHFPGGVMSCNNTIISVASQAVKVHV